MFGAGDKVGTIGTINDGTYNKQWVIYTITGNTYQLFPMQNLTKRVMDPTNTNAGGYTGSSMYSFVHNTVLPNLRKSGLNIIACDLVSREIYLDILRKTGMTGKDIAGKEIFWSEDPYTYDYESFFCIELIGPIEIYQLNKGYNANYTDSAGDSLGVRPLITVVK